MQPRIYATIPRQDQLPSGHPCRDPQRAYYAMYVLPVRDALEAAGVVVSDAKEPEPAGVLVRFTLEGDQSEDAGTLPKTRATLHTIIDYADQVHIDGLVKEAHGLFDACFKMKPCDRFMAEYEACDFAVYPWGYIISPGHDTLEDRKWYFETLDELRAARDRTPSDKSILTRGAFHAMHLCPERRKLFDPSYYQGEKSDASFRDHVAAASVAGFCLNACGPDNTIDRKVVEFCGVGAAILSNDGIADLRLPWGKRFVHGENVWFVKTAEEAKAVARSMPEDIWRKLIRGSRELFDACFAPKSIGRWMIHCVTNQVGMALR